MPSGRTRYAADRRPDGLSLKHCPATHGSTHSPKTTLELLLHLQRRVQLGDQRRAGIGKTSLEQPDLLVHWAPVRLPELAVASFSPIA